MRLYEGQVGSAVGNIYKGYFQYGMPLRAKDDHSGY